MSATERGTVIEPPQNIWSMYSGRGFSNMSHPTVNEISNDEHLEGRRVVHWNPRVIGLTGGCLVLIMVLALSLGLSLGGRNNSSELNLADWQDACQNDHLSGKGWNRCIKQCQLYVCCDGRPGDCNLDRDPFCNRYDGWCAVLRVSAEYRESGQLTDDDDDDVPPSMTPPTGNYGSYPTNTEDPIVPVSGEPTSVPPTATTLAPTLMPTTSSPPTGNTTLAPTLTPTASSPPTGNTTLAPTLIPAISSPPSLRPSRAPVVAPKITPSPTETPTTRAPARTFKM